MTELEEQRLKFYLVKARKILTEADFPGWLQKNSEGEKQKHALAFADEYIKGYEAGWKAHQDHLAQAFDAKPDMPKPPWSVEIGD